MNRLVSLALVALMSAETAGCGSRPPSATRGLGQTASPALTPVPVPTPIAISLSNPSPALLQSTSPLPEPTDYVAPTPICPAPPNKVQPPTVIAAVGASAVVATNGNSGYLTCSTADTSDAAQAMSIDERFESSYRDHSAAIRGKALQMTRDPELAADVTQEAFLRLLIELQAGRTPDNISAWLYRTASNLIVSGFRHAAVERRIAPRLIREVAPAQPEAVAILREAGGQVQVMLRGLTDIDRAALLPRV